MFWPQDVAVSMFHKIPQSTRTSWKSRLSDGETDRRSRMNQKINPPIEKINPKLFCFCLDGAGTAAVANGERSRQGGQAGWAPPPLPPSTFCKMTLQDIVFVSNRHRLVTVWTPITRLIFPPLTLHQLRFVHQINWNWCNFFDISTGRFVPTRRRP